MQKKSLLVWADSPVTKTGFGIVTNFILKSLYKTNKYEIDILGINHFQPFYNKTEYPYQITSSRLLDPGDPYGRNMFLKAIQEKEYDIIWIMNDSYVVHPVADKMKEIIWTKNYQTKVIYYYPIDCTLPPNSEKMILAADKAVTYTQWAAKKTFQVLPHIEGRVDVIHHGVDTSVFKPLPEEEVLTFRRNKFQITDDTFLIVNINRNSPRKDLARTILAFKEFKTFLEGKPTKLYLHTVPHEKQPGINIDLTQPLIHLALKMGEDVIFPAKYSPTTPFTEEQLNLVYNAAAYNGCFLSTALGEGFGLSSIESLAAGCPVILGDHSSTSEILGDNWERGLIYPCREEILIDNSGYRRMGRMTDILFCLRSAYSKDKNLKEMISRGLSWCKEHDWDIIGQQWVKVFESVLAEKPNKLQAVKSSKIVGEDL